MHLPVHRLCALLITLCVVAACSGRDVPRSAPRLPQADCLPGERGFLRAKFRGAIEAEPDWRGAELQCEGGARPDGSGVRVSFLGPADLQGRRLRMVFGIGAKPGLGASHSVPTNVTVIVEGQKQLYGTQGDNKCEVESMVQEPVIGKAAARSTLMREYRIAARGYCIDPASSLDGTARLYIDRFDFAGLARFNENELLPLHLATLGAHALRTARLRRCCRTDRIATGASAASGGAGQQTSPFRARRCRSIQAPAQTGSTSASPTPMRTGNWDSCS